MLINFFRIKVFSLREKLLRKADENIEEIELDNINNLADFVNDIGDCKEASTVRPKCLRNPIFVPKSCWDEGIKSLHKEKKESMIRYFRMTTAHCIAYKRLNTLFKKKIKIARNLLSTGLNR